MIKFKLFPAAVKNAHWNSGIVIPSKFFAQFSTQLYVYLYTSSSPKKFNNWIEWKWAAISGISAHDCVT